MIETPAHVTRGLAARRGPRPSRAGAVLAFGAWIGLWVFFLVFVAGPAGRLAGAGRREAASLFPGEAAYRLR